MIRLLALLGAGMFLALLIGGQDRGQVRQGLRAAPPAAATPAAATPAAAAAEPVAAAPPADVDLSGYVPVSAPVATVVAPLIDSPQPAPPAGLAPGSAAAQAPEIPTFTLSGLQAAPGADADPAPPAVRYVAATAINVRQGPSTGQPVVGRLTRNEAVSVVEDTGDGWLRIRIEGDGIEGYVAARLLTDRAPDP